MIILGIDPGFARVGWAIMDAQSSKYNLRNCGCVETSKDMPSDERLVDVYKQVCKLIKKYKLSTVSKFTLKLKAFLEPFTT